MVDVENYTFPKIINVLIDNKDGLVHSKLPVSLDVKCWDILRYQNEAILNRQQSWLK
jgi:hypothetical protein